MPAKATVMRVPTPGTFLGKFRIKKFNISESDECREYERIRTLGNQASSGIVIENVRDLSEITEWSDDQGNKTRQEKWYIVISWWENDEVVKKDPPLDSERTYVERPAKTLEES